MAISLSFTAPPHRPPRRPVNVCVLRADSGFGSAPSFFRRQWKKRWAAARWMAEPLARPSVGNRSPFLGHPIRCRVPPPAETQLHDPRAPHVDARQRGELQLLQQAGQLGVGDGHGAALEHLHGGAQLQLARRVRLRRLAQQLLRGCQVVPMLVQWTCILTLPRP